MPRITPPRRHQRGHFLAPLSLLLLPPALASAGPTVSTFQIIGADVQLSARAISADGSILIGAGLDPTGSTRHTMSWSASTGLNPAGNPGSIQYSIPTAVSADGTIIVGYDQTPDNNRRAWRYTPQTGYQYLPFDPSIRSVASAVSADGQTIVGAISSGATEQPYRYNNSIQYLPDFNPSQDPYHAYSADLISADASTIVGQTALFWTAATGSQRFHTGISDVNVFFGAVNANGSIIFGVDHNGTNSDDAVKPFRSVNGVVTPLPLPPNFARIISITGCSADGSRAVGYGYIPDAQGYPLQYVPFLWSDSTGFLTLPDLFAQSAVDPADYTFDTAWGISADGNSLFGWGREHGIQPSSWLITLPEPSSLAILGLSPFLLLRPRRP